MFRLAWLKHGAKKPSRGYGFRRSLPRGIYIESKIPRWDSRSSAATIYLLGIRRRVMIWSILISVNAQSDSPIAVAHSMRSLHISTLRLESSREAHGAELATWREGETAYSGAVCISGGPSVSWQGGDVSYCGLGQIRQPPRMPHSYTNIQTSVSGLLFIEKLIHTSATFGG